VTRDLLKDIEKKSMGFNKKILVLHQAIDRYLPFDPELSIADIPQNFNYYAFGHIHERIIDDFGEGKLVYPGSPEIWRIDELKSFKKKGKGFFMVNMDLDVPEVRKIDIKLPREIIKETVEYHRLDEEIGRIQKNILNLNKKPLLHITIDGGHFERSDVYERLNRALSNLCLSVRPNYRLDSLDTSNVITSDRGVLDIKEILRKKLEEFENQELSDFAIGILNELSNGDFKRAEELVQEFYEVSYDN
jgi:DNA repair exonuclease SbcCD nuclease subunit